MNLEPSSLRLLVSATLAVSLTGACGTIHNIGDNPDATGGTVNAGTAGSVATGGTINAGTGGSVATGGSISVATGGTVSCDELQNTAKATFASFVAAHSGCSNDADCVYEGGFDMCVLAGCIALNAGTASAAASVATQACAQANANNCPISYRGCPAAVAACVQGTCTPRYPFQNTGGTTGAGGAGTGGAADNGTGGTTCVGAPPGNCLCLADGTWGHCLGDNPDPRVRSCTDSGGTAQSGLCCSASPEFPNTCGVGACSCSPANSTTITVCECPSGTCFDGTACVTPGGCGQGATCAGPSQCTDGLGRTCLCNGGTYSCT